MRLCLLLLALLLCPFAASSSAQAQSVAVKDITPDGVIITRTGDRYRLAGQGNRAGLLPLPPPLPGSTPTPDAPGLVPHGTVARGSGDIAFAWLADATARYAHGILGDRLEAATLRLRMAGDGRILQRVLPDHQVFEDLSPRLADMDGDGVDEVIVVRSDRDLGAALVVYGLREGAVTELAATAPPGLPNRWLNPIGAADFDGDGIMEVAAVETPHGNGVLRVWEWADGALVLQGDMPGVSNHAIGTPVLDLHAVRDMTGDGRPDILVPDQARTTLRVLTVGPTRIHESTRIALPGALGTRIVATAYGFIMGTTDGDLALVPLQP